MKPPADHLELADLQGNVLRGYGFGHALYLFARVRDTGPARAFLAGLAGAGGDVVTAEEWTQGKPATALNVALAHRALAALGVPEPVLAGFPEEFRAGMAARAPVLGDEGRSAPDRWEDGLRDGEIEVLLTVHGRDRAALDAAAGALRARLDAPGSGLEHTHEQPAGVLPFGREHFGFSDGFAQPAVEGDGQPAVPGRGIPERWWPWQRASADRPRSRRGRIAWRSLHAGEFVLGYDDEDGTRPPAPAGPWGRNGTFMVWRKLAQDVAAFRAFTGGWAQRLGREEEWVAARTVGRWRDGSPLELAPGRPDPALAGDNDFSYAGDRQGMRCPRGAHVRRTNPRDGLGWGGTLTARHRIIRRGMPYGEPLPEGAADDGADRGLIFVCLQASIARQFEIVQSQWINDGNAFGLGHDPDPLLGPPGRPGKLTIEGAAPAFLSPLPACVTVRGGEYLFVPGLAALRSLSPDG